MAKNHKKQRGLTAIGFVLLLGLIAFFAALAIKLAPLYLENFEVSSVLKSVAQESDIGSKSVADIKDSIMKKLSINDVSRVTKDDIEVSKEDGKLRVTISYEARVPMVGNIDIVANFKDNKIEVPLP
ncbi:MAG: DUF4845 domain-containing protein [Gammaproteobacteria bacterium]|nr:DUF4845 domain-containing protein [Gammaproteobacteria bacterium]